MNLNLFHTSDELQLIKGCKDQDDQARKFIYMRYVEDMMLLCMRYITNKEDAREVLMDAFLKFFNSINDFEYRGEGSVKAWLKKITINYCLMFLRKNNISFEQISDRDFYNELPAAESIIDQLNVKEILKLIHALPPGCKTIFNLYVFEGRSHKEIATLLNVTEGTSKSQLHLARMILKDKILINI